MAERQQPSQELLLTLKEWKGLTSEVETAQRFGIERIFQGVHEEQGDPAFPVRMEIQTKYEGRLFRQINKDTFLRRGYLMPIVEAPVYNGPKLSYVFEVPASNVLRIWHGALEQDLNAYLITLYESGRIEAAHQKRTASNVDPNDRRINDHNIIASVRTSELAQRPMPELVARLIPYRTSQRKIR